MQSFIDVNNVDSRGDVNLRLLFMRGITNAADRSHDKKDHVFEQAWLHLGIENPVKGLGADPEELVNEAA